MLECLFVITLFLAGFEKLSISFFVTNFPVFFLRRDILLSKHLEAHPRQMQLDMCSLEALQVSRTSNSCDMSFYKLSSFPSVYFQASRLIRKNSKLKR